MSREIRARRPDWTPGLPVVFGDGEAWHVPRPMVGFPTAAGSRPESNRHFGDGFHAAREAILVSDDDSSMLVAVARMAADLLRRNYRLAAADLDGLLVAHFEDPEDDQWVRQVLKLAMGTRTTRTSARWMAVCGFLMGSHAGPMPLEDVIYACHWGSQGPTVGDRGIVIPAPRCPTYADWNRPPERELTEAEAIRAFGRAFGL